ncbi:hypothetical protein HND97_15360 [Vibrio cholerae]|nr:hypothetical protein HND97_15360 [Vibrio cholerae]
MMVGRKLELQYPRIAAQQGDISLEEIGLTGKGVHDVSFTLKKAKYLAFLA